MRGLRMILMLAILLMPLGMQPASAATHPTAMPMSHCPEQGTHHSSKDAVGGCTMACSAALPASETAADELMPPTRLPLFAAKPHALVGLHAEIATPPPRLS